MPAPPYNLIFKMSKEQFKTTTIAIDAAQAGAEPENEPTLDVYDAARVRAACKDLNSLNFYSHHPIGQLLVEWNLKTHPVLREKLLQDEKLLDLQERILHSGIVKDQSAASRFAEAEPDFQPKTENQLILETCIDQAIQIVTINAVYSDQYEDLAQFDFRNDMESHIGDLRDTTKLAALQAAFPAQLEERQYVFLRDTFLNALAKRDYLRVLEVLDRFYDNSTWKNAAQRSGTLVLANLASEPVLQRVATQALIKKLVQTDEESFNKYAQFLEECGLSLAENKLENAGQDFVSRQLETLWERSPLRYYEVIELLLYYELVSAEHLAQNRWVKLRTMQFILYSFRIGKYSLAREQATAIITKQLKLHSPEDLQAAHSRVLWMNYCQACNSEDLVVDPELANFYRQGRINRYSEDDEE